MLYKLDKTSVLLDAVEPIFQLQKVSFSPWSVWVGFALSSCWMQVAIFIKDSSPRQYLALVCDDIQHFVAEAAQSTPTTDTVPEPCSWTITATGVLTYTVM